MVCLCFDTLAPTPSQTEMFYSQLSEDNISDGDMPKHTYSEHIERTSQFLFDSRCVFLADIFENFKDVCMTYCGPDPM